LLESCKTKNTDMFNIALSKGAIHCTECQGRFNTKHTCDCTPGLCSMHTLVQCQAVDDISSGDDEIRQALSYDFDDDWMNYNPDSEW
jgi:hypothetical protein